jgi:hypothetical protein
MLTTAFLTQTFSKGFIIADYYSNIAAYAKNCVNKARPMLHCNGKCQLMKKLQQQQDDQQDKAAQWGNLKSEVLSTKSFYPSLSKPAFTISSSVKNGAPISVKITDRSYGCFHPPQV